MTEAPSLSPMMSLSKTAASLDVQDLRRQMVMEALDGVVTQASWAARFLELGDPDMHVEGAMSRMAVFARAALATMKELSAETRRLAGAKVTN